MNIDEVRQKYPQYEDLTDEQLLTGIHAKHYSDIPIDDFMANFAQPEDYGTEPIQNEQGQYQVGGPVEPLDIGTGIIAPVVEPALALGSGIVAETVGNIGGGIQQAIKPSPMAGPEAAERIKSIMTYQPRSRGAQQIMSRYGQTLEPVGEFIEKGRLGDEVLEAGGPEWLAANAEAIPEYAGALLAATGLRQPRARPVVDKSGNLVPGMSEKARLAMELKNTPQKTTTAKFKLSDGKVIKDPAGKAALGQNWTPETVAGVKGANPATKLKINKIIDIARNRLTGGAKVKMKTRPSDVAGESLMNRYKFVKGANREAGQLLDRVARGVDTPVDISNPLQWFKGQLDDVGIRIMADGKIDFSASSLPKSDYGLIRENIRHIQRTIKGQASFYNAHKLKQILRRTGLSYEQTVAKKGASPDAQNIFKGFSSKIDEVLDGQSRAYDTANIKFGETRNVMNAIEKIAKDNLFTESADTQLGVLTRRMMGNPVSRGSIIDMADNIDDIARKYGARFDDDLYLQSWVAHDMDDVIEVAAKTSIKGEAVGPQVAGAMERSSIGHAAHALDMAGRFISRKSEIKALDTLQALTR